MFIDRIGFTAVKGGRHVATDAVELTPEGPVGDRVFALVDPVRGRVVRTVEHPSLIRTVASWDAGVLSVRFPDTFVEGVPSLTGDVLKVDYWGRTAQLELVDGPWSDAYSEHLGRDVRLARASYPGEIVYGAAVSLVTTGSLRQLADRVGAPVSGARFRPTFVLDTGTAEPHVEDGWIGRRLMVGDACLEVRGVVPRCAVVDRDPVTGERDAHVLETLAGYRLDQGEIGFGVDAVVTAPGRVRSRDVARLESD